MTGDRPKANKFALHRSGNFRARIQPGPHLDRRRGLPDTGRMTLPAEGRSAWR
jgi:hypothetical protein